MSRNKGRDHVRAEYYDKFLYGDSGKFASNPTNDRLAVIERMYKRILTEHATNRFKWIGMPDSIDVRFLELNLFYRALCVFFFDEKYGKFFAMRGGAGGNVNMFDNPTHFFVTGPMHTGRYLKAFNSIVPDAPEIEVQRAECVPIWSNYLRVPDLDIVLIYARKLAELDLTIEINSKNARRTKIAAVSDNQRLSLVNINRQIDEGQSLVQISEGFDIAGLSALDLGVNPDSIEKLHILKVRLWSECMTLLGIDNANQDKKERLVAAEVDANDDQISMSRAVSLNARKMAADAINDRYNLAVSVEYATDVDDQLSGINFTDFSGLEGI